MTDDTRRGRLEPCQFLDAVNDLARDAGRRILEIYHTDFDVEQKDDRSPLTAADMAAHNAIVAGLQVLDPAIPTLSEESAGVPFAERSQWDCYWLIDPLDGTREFVKRNGEFTVNIALIRNGEPVLGVVHVPVSGVSYYGCRGQGAFRQTAGAPPEPIRVREHPADPLMVAGSRSHAGDSLKRFLGNMGEYEIISMGSALKLCLVAEGKADIYPRLGPTSEWDTAAAQCVVEEAGGRVTDTEMNTLRYNTKDSLLNPFFLVFGDKTRDWSKYL
ncbi:MAG: 3'(2'),5'-bisphosphate nucleotidase CysQ [Gammaproteobacteria bacterium]